VLKGASAAWASVVAVVVLAVGAAALSLSTTATRNSHSLAQRAIRSAGPAETVPGILPSTSVPTASYPATATIPPPTPSTALPATGPWPLRDIAETVNAQDITPTADAIYWLAPLRAVGGAQYGGPFKVFRYDLASADVMRGPSMSGSPGSPALTVTGGWVWTALGLGSDVVVHQLDPSTLAIHSTYTLRVKDSIWEPPEAPVLTATVNGPLWVAGGEDIWALNPSTGVIETEFDARDEVFSISTDPSGSLLYTSGSTGTGWSVTEYSAQTGAERGQSGKGSFYGLPSVGAVAATSGGVWVSFRSGMTGNVVELPANGFRTLAPPPQQGAGAFEAVGGVWVNVSAGTLWVTGLGTSDDPTLTCADPANGAIRGTETAVVNGAIARDGVVYGFAPLGNGARLVAITPPPACFK
jgi:hypothetical protein